MSVILLIDDNRMLSLVEARYIQRSIADTNIVVASNGASTLELAKARHPDVTILDTELTEMDALTLHRSLCDIVSPSSILVTSNHPAPAFSALKREGQICNLLIRPFPIAKLTGQVEEILVSQGIQVRPHRSSSQPAITTATPECFDRHMALNQLSGMLGALRAFEAEVEADGNAPPSILALMDEYIPRIADLIQAVAQNIKHSKKNEMKR